MSNNREGPTGSTRRVWPEPPPFRPEPDKIIFIESGRWTDPKPTWVQKVLHVLGLR